ncbi:MAG: type II secretion system protein M [Pseudomonadota bacterium]|nr:type II secretion system protein M [Pseudomonadota bacterium]
MIGWWRTRSLREQRLLLAMGALALLLLSWLLVIRPLGDALSSAKERHGAAVVALAEANAQADAIRAAQSGPQVALTEPIDALVSRAATEAGFPIARLERQSASQVTLVLDAVRPQAFFGWIDAQEQASGLIVEQLIATPNTDQTLAVQVTFRARSG